MTVKEAVEYCESHECEDCPVYKGHGRLGDLDYCILFLSYLI